MEPGTREQVLRVVLRPRAVREIQTAIEWYEAQRAGSGQAYRDAIEEALESLREFPEAAPAVLGSVRRVLLQGFPFGVFYVVRKNLLVVLAVMHVRRDPSRWPAR